MNQSNRKLILDISQKYNLSHIGSNLSVLPVLEEIYNKKKKGDIVILDNAHAHLSHLLYQGFEFLTAMTGKKAQDKDIQTFAEKHIKRDIHCNRAAHCDASGGSLGHGIGIGIGYALADRKRTVYVVVSDGSMMEGSNWEALRIADDFNLTNLEIHCNFNGFTAVALRNPLYIYKRMKLFFDNVTFWLTDNTKDFDGVEGHYKTI
jgi:transketolase N-terminal domain/subunit